MIRWLYIALAPRDTGDKVRNPILEELIFPTLGAATVFITQVDQRIARGLFHILVELYWKSGRP